MSEVVFIGYVSGPAVKPGFTHPPPVAGAMLVETGQDPDADYYIIERIARPIEDVEEKYKYLTKRIGVACRVLTLTRSG
jgi:hypothetical protein